MNVEALVGWIWIAAMAVFIGAGARFAVRWLLHRFDGAHRAPLPDWWQYHSADEIERKKRGEL